VRITPDRARFEIAPEKEWFGVSGILFPKPTARIGNEVPDTPSHRPSAMLPLNGFTKPAPEFLRL
jgi:hypothetical protein